LTISWGLCSTYRVNSCGYWLCERYCTRITIYCLSTTIKCYRYTRYWSSILLCCWYWSLETCSSLYCWWIIWYSYCWWRKNNSCTSWSSSWSLYWSFCTILRSTYSISSSSCWLSEHNRTRIIIYSLNAIIKCYLYIRYRSIRLICWYWNWKIVSCNHWGWTTCYSYSRIYGLGGNTSWSSSRLVISWGLRCS